MDDRIHYLKVNRVEVIDSTGRAFTRYYEDGIGVEAHLQDAGRTLKVFAGTPDAKRFRVTPDAKVVDVETEDVIYKGEPLTEERVEQIVESTRRQSDKLIEEARSFMAGCSPDRLMLRLASALEEAEREIAELRRGESHRDPSGAGRDEAS